MLCSHVKEKKGCSCFYLDVLGNTSNSLIICRLVGHGLFCSKYPCKFSAHLNSIASPYPISFVLGPGANIASVKSSVLFPQ